MNLAQAKTLRFGLLTEEEMGSILLAGRRAGAHSGVDPSQKSNLEDVLSYWRLLEFPKRRMLV